MKINHSMQVGWYVADMVQDISGQIDGDIKNWPSHMQDQVYTAIEALNKRTGRDYELLRTLCDRDIDTGWYVIVTVRAPKTIDTKGIIH